MSVNNSISMSEKMEHLRNFLKYSNKPVDEEPNHGEGVIVSAVCVCLYRLNDQLYTVLGLKSSYLREHANEVSFPGGKIEAGETTQDAALREANEEVNLNPKYANYISTLQPISSHDNTKLIYPVVFEIKNINDIEPDNSEIQRVVIPKITELYENKYEETWYIKHSKAHTTLTFYPYQDLLVWGLTGRILNQLQPYLRYAGIL